MSRGLTKETVVEAAVGLIEEYGKPAVSMRELAGRLNIKTPSLYNHVKNADELLLEVCRYAVGQIVEAQLSAMQGLTGDAAIEALARAYRTFAREHPGLYRMIMAIPAENDEQLLQIALPVAQPALRALSGYGLTHDESMHWQRVLRSILHGFVSQEAAGYFAHSSVCAEQSYELAVRCFLSGLHSLGGGEEIGH